MSFYDRETISIHVGQAGIQMGDATWRQFGLEHGIGNDGLKVSEQKSATRSVDDLCTAFYTQTSGDRFMPRAIFVDTEPIVIDQLRSNECRHLFHPGRFVSGLEDAANNFARGYIGIGREMIDRTMETIRRVAEECNNLQGCFLFHSFGGGTGSGFGALIAKSIADELTQRCMLEFSIFPSPTISNSVVEPYNSVLMTHAKMDTVHCSFLIDNEAIYDMCTNRLSVSRPTYDNLNRLISQVVSSITASLRFNGDLNVDMNEFQTNLVPYPWLHFPMVAFSPLTPREMVAHDTPSVGELTSQLFKSTNQMVKCNPAKGKYMACCLLYRGDVLPRDINAAIMAVKQNRTINFVSWCQTGFKIGINSKCPVMAPDGDLASARRSISLLSSNTAIGEGWHRIDRQYDMMYAKRAFVHWYLGEGLDEFEFVDAREDLATLEMDYREAARS